MNRQRSFARSLPPIIGLAILAFGSVASAGSIDFEGLADTTTVGATYSGMDVVFVNAVALSAGISLDEAEFPPHSGTNVAADLSGPIVLQFSTPVTSFQGFFTYATSLSLVGSLVGSTVDSTSSAFSSNFVSSGNPPNELLQLGSAAGIDTITITGDSAGGSFVVDDITFATGTVSVVVPEPASWVLLSIGLFGAAIGRRVWTGRN